MSAIDAPIDITTEATLLVDEIVAALVNARIYATTHPRVQDSIGAVQATVGELAKASGQDPVRSRAPTASSCSSRSRCSVRASAHRAC
jgi:hypothetical protein